MSLYICDKLLNSNNCVLREILFSFNFQPKVNGHVQCITWNWIKMKESEQVISTFTLDNGFQLSLHQRMQIIFATTSCVRKAHQSSSSSLPGSSFKDSSGFLSNQCCQKYSLLWMVLENILVTHRNWLTIRTLQILHLSIKNI